MSMISYSPCPALCQFGGAVVDGIGTRMRSSAAVQVLLTVRWHGV